MSRLRMFWLLVAIWCVPALLLTLASYGFDGPNSVGGALELAALREGPPWLIWVAMTPVILARARRPDAMTRRALTGHIALGVVITLVFGAVGGTLGHFVRVGTDPLDLAGAIRMGLTDWAPFQPLVFAAVFATGFAIESGRRRRAAELARAQLEAQLATAQLSALRAQLHPHFLFNTLNAAVALARSGDAIGTARVLVLLGDLLRQLLRHDAPQEVPLREELALLEIYLEIQRIRFGDRLQVGWHVADDVRDALVPQLVLQPLVENALQHGIAPRARAGRLDITAVRRGNRLRLVVCDDGPGIEPGFSLAAASGLGLRNTRDRLRQLYGARGEFALATAGELTTAAIELPLHTAAVEAVRD